MAKLPVIPKAYRLTSLALAFILCIGGALYYRTSGLSNHPSMVAGQKIQATNLALTSYYKDGSVRLAAFNPVTLETKEIYAAPVAVKTEPISNLTASVSASGEVVFGLDYSLYLGKLGSSTVKKVKEGVLSDGVHQAKVAYYSSPRWFANDTRISYIIGGYEYSAWETMKSDGSDVITSDSGMQIENPTIPGKYLQATGNGMATSTGMWISDSLKKDAGKQILSDDMIKKIMSIDSATWSLDGKKIYFTYGLSEESIYGIASILPDGTGYTEILKGKEIITGLIRAKDSDTLFYNKRADYSGPYTGIYSLSNGKEETVIALDGAYTYALSAEADQILLGTDEGKESSEPDSLFKLSLYSLTNKKTTSFAEYPSVRFAGWIKSNILPADVKSVSSLAPTATQLSAFAYSQTSKGWLYDTFYDVCWDFDCAVTPPAKLVASKQPVRVNYGGSTTRNKLTGTKVVSVINVTTDVAIPDWAMQPLTDPNQPDSLGQIAAKITSEAKRLGQDLTFRFDTSRQLMLDKTCAKPTDGNGFSGAHYQVTSDCLVKQIMAAYPTLPKDQSVIVYLHDQRANGPEVVDYTMDYPIYYQPDADGNQEQIFHFVRSKLIQVGSISGGVDSARGQQYIRDHVREGLHITAPDILSKLYTVRSSQGYSGTEWDATGNGTCLYTESTDMSCGLTATPQIGRVKTADLVISPLTQKELGWFDADGDGVDEVRDICPYDAKNACK